MLRRQHLAGRVVKNYTDMKLGIIFPILFFHAVLSAQVELKDVSIQSVNGTEYYVLTDTTSDGSITVTLKPVQDQVKEIDAQLAQIAVDIARYTELIDETQQNRKAAAHRQKELEKLKNKLKAGKEATPAPPAPPKQEEEIPTPQKRKKKRKQ